MDVDLIFGWSAKRAGGRITVTGKAEDGTPMKVPNVDRIEGPSAPGSHPIATDKNGDRYHLVA